MLITCYGSQSDSEVSQDITDGEPWKEKNVTNRG